MNFDKMSLRHILLPIIFLWSLNQAKAQVDTLSISENHKLLFSISGGVAIPVGKFSTFEINPKTYTENIVGVAGMGYNGKFQVMYLFTKSIGVSCMLFSSVNKGQAVDSADLFYDPAPGTHGQGGGSYVNSYNYTTKNWYTNAVLAGIVIVAKKDNPILNFRISGGAQKVQCPESKWNVLGTSWTLYWDTIHPYSVSIVQPSMSSTNFIFNLGVDLQVRLKKRFGMIASVDFLASHSSFSGQSTYNGDYFNSVEQVYYEGSESVSFAKNISLFNINVGFYYAIQ
jgi:hypothetical protein